MPRMLTLDDQYQAAKMLGEAKLLLHLDEVWTQFLENAESVSEDEIYELQGMTERMVYLLTRMSENTSWAKTQVKRNSKSLEVAWKTTLDRLPIKASERDTLQQKIAKQGGFLKFADTSLSACKRLSNKEVQMLRRKTRNVSSGQWTKGDLSAKGRCALLGAITVVAALCGQFEFAALTGAVGAVDCL